MKNGMENAVWQMKQKEEDGLNYIYSQTYNFVYLRAKSILKNEEDIKLFMQTVYVDLYRSADEIQLDNLYEWIGKHVYRIGCEHFKKRKEREAAFVEMEEKELNPKQKQHLNENVDVISKSLEQLPDLYQATLFAFYFDYLKMDEIADLMDCSVGVIINRLNYTRKYFKKAIENAWEERDESKEGCDTFSVEAVCLALRKWGVEHCLGITSAQNIYYNICKTLDLHGHSISLSGKEFAGVKKTVVYYKADDWNPIQEEIIIHGKKKRLDKRLAVCLAGAAVVLAIVAVVIAVVVNRPEKKKPSSEEPKVTKEQNSSKKEEQKQENTDAKEPEDQTNGTVDEPVSEPADQQTDESADEPASEPAKTDYIFPNSGTTELTREEVQGHTKEELRIARNEIYARHGAIFGVDDLDAYFQSKSWYTPTLSISELLDTVELSMVEENNISLISEIESGM